MWNQTAENQNMASRLLTKKRATVFALILGLAGFQTSGQPKSQSATASAGKLPPAEEVIEKSIEALGGKAAMEKIRSRVMKGTLEVEPQGLKGSVTIYAAAPNRSYEVVELEGLGKEEAGTDGEVFWMISTAMGPRLLEGDERAAKARETRFNAELHWRELYTKAECAEEVEVEGHPCYKVVFTPATGAPVTVYYDRKTWLPTRQDMTMTGPMGTLSLTTILSDYRKCAGVLIPHRMSTTVAGTPARHTVVLESVESNVDIPAERFALPEPIRALVEKSRAQTKPAEPPAGGKPSPPRP
jgi:outer membrane lipoprotein-sorting protein